SEFRRLDGAGQLPHLGQLLADPVTAYVGDAHARFTALSLLFRWLLQQNDATRSRADRAPCRDWIAALLRGGGRAQAREPAGRRDAAGLERELLACPFR